MKRRTLYFTGPRKLELREEQLAPPGADELLVQTELSAISAGSEMLVYRGEFPRQQLDIHDAISSSLDFPLAYGYAAVGRVVQVGKALDPAWQDRRVFGFQAHSSHFIASMHNLLAVPADVTVADAVFLPNMETAVNFVQDAEPILGERALVFGQGVVGLLSAALLSRFPLECLVTVDRYGSRRKESEDIGATEVLDPALPGFREAALQHTGPARSGFDFALELTGNPHALDDAIALTAFSGRIIVGSWFGDKKVNVDLGGRYHRSRIQLISSQVSTISPRLAGRWDKARRFETAWSALRSIRPSRWITHRFALDRAAEAYQLLDESPESAIQILFTYP